MKHTILVTILAVLGLLAAGRAQAQTSVLRDAVQRDAQRQANADAEFMRQAGRHFFVVAPGVVRDNRTRLEWMRCSIGQDWNERSQRCDGEAEAFRTFSGGEAIARRLNQAGGYNGRADWRMPTKDELAGLVVCSKGRTGDRCADGSSRPTIAQGVFPLTSDGPYWTSSPFVDNPIFAWYVSFHDGSVYHGYCPSGCKYVRLVRATQ